MDSIYLDNNATTSLLPPVWEAMRPLLTGSLGNPASAHHAGRRARQALEDAREKTAALLDAHPDEVIFTSGATEANNLALFGLAGPPPGHLISSPIEHPSVAEPLRRLTERGFALDLLPVDTAGVVQADVLPRLLRPETRLVSVMLANNETGALQPIRELIRRVKGQGSESREDRNASSPAPAPCPLTPAFHCDAAQAVGRLPVRFHELDVTALTLSAHKFHGPPGVGALLLRRGARLEPQLWGGHQQRGRRPGTEPVALAVGLAAALELAEREREARLEHVQRLRRRFLERLRATAAPVVLNGPETGGVPHTLNLSFPGCRAESLLMALDLAGVCCSTGSACSSGSLLPSPVLQAMGVPDEVLRSAMRFSLSHLLTEAEIDEAARRIAAAVARLRRTDAE
ncbi:MAG TPA: cysteine desulfurase family protein [Gemmataceae bacterium]|nr:cysteine desulfurase family protein [Gemmataceae bacterium]